MVRIKVNGKNIETEGNKTLLDVIKENNLAEIPTLCHIKDLIPYGACSICLAENKKTSKLIRTCAMPVEDGMEIETDTESVKESQKMNLEFMLSKHYADCYAPCRLSCPANVDIQGYIALAKQGLYFESIKLMKETNPLPLICGKVCAKPCEDACRRNLIDEPVDIKNIKRYVAEYDLASDAIYVPEIKPDTGKKIAVIGSGPAGLSAAYFLRLEGHLVTIFEMMPEAGGMMCYGIPEYRLPKADLKSEINTILNLGIEIKFNQKLGKNFTINDLQESGYNAIFLGIGAQSGKGMGTPGSDLEGVIQGVDFLREVNLGKAEKLYGRVFIIGGGNTAIDAARTSLRWGAEKVVIIYRRTETEMPAAREEIEDAIEENIELRILTNPVEYSGENGKLKSVKLIKMELGEPDESGRRRPVEIENSEYTENVDFVLEAIGQEVDPESIEKVELTRWNTILADKNLLTTNIDGVFAGGDAVTGPSIIISAVAQGRKAAYNIDRYLNGIDLQPENRLGFHISKEDFGKLSENEFSSEEKLKRDEMPKVPAKERVNSFIEVEKGLTESDMMNESKRCLKCGCQDIYQCDLKKYSNDFAVEKDKFIWKNDGNDNGFTSKSEILYDIEDVNPFIIRNFNKCILCGKCVQVCNNIQVNNAISLGYRGKYNKIVTAGDRQLKDSDCVFCGECVQVCPCGALEEKDIIYAGYPWEDRKVRTICGHCGVGCQIYLHVKTDKVVRISGVEDAAPNYGSLCVKGRYGFDFINSKDRLTTPLIKKNGEFQQATWDEALKMIAERFTGIINDHGPDSIGILSSPRATNEENYIAQKFARAVLKTNNISYYTGLSQTSTVAGLAASFGSDAMTNSIGDIGKSDVILITGSNITETHPVISSYIKRAVKNNGVKLIIVDPRKLKIADFSEISISPNQGTDIAWINGLIHIIIKENLYDKNFVKNRTDGFRSLKKNIKKYTPEYVEKITGISQEDIIKAARLYANSDNASIFYSSCFTQHTSGTDNVKSLANLAMLCGNIGKEGAGINPLRSQSNEQGACDMGCLPHVFSGNQEVTNRKAVEELQKAWDVDGLSPEPGLTSTEMIAKAISGEIKSLYILGETTVVSSPDINHIEKSLSKCDFVVVNDIFMTETAKLADIVLPSLCFAEKDGTFTNTERKVQRIKKSIPAPGSAKPDWEILSKIAEKMDYKMSYENSEEIFKEMVSLTPSYTGIDYSRIDKNGLQWPCPDKSHPGTDILHKDQFTCGKGRFHIIDYD